MRIVINCKQCFTVALATGISLPATRRPLRRKRRQARRRSVAAAPGRRPLRHALGKSWLALRHRPGNQPLANQGLQRGHERFTFGYAIEDTTGRRFAYLTDTAGLPPRTEAFLKNWRPRSVALDCTHPPENDPPHNHNDLTIVLEIAETLTPAKVWLTRIRHEMDAWLMNKIDALPPRLAVAVDSQLVSDAGAPPEAGS